MEIKTYDLRECMIIIYQINDAFIISRRLYFHQVDHMNGCSNFPTTNLTSLLNAKHLLCTFLKRGIGKRYNKVYLSHSRKCLKVYRGCIWEIGNTHVIDAIYRTMMHKSNKKAAFELIVSARYPFPFFDYESYYTIHSTSN